MSPQINWTELEKFTSAHFVNEVKQYVDWSENTKQVELIDTGMTKSDDFLSIVLVTNQNIIQLIYNQDTNQTTIGTASRDACMYAVNIWDKLQ